MAPECSVCEAYLTGVSVDICQRHLPPDVDALRREIDNVLRNAGHETFEDYGNERCLTIRDKDISDLTDQLVRIVLRTSAASQEPEWCDHIINIDGSWTFEHDAMDHRIKVTVQESWMVCPVCAVPRPSKKLCPHERLSGSVLDGQGRHWCAICNAWTL